MTTPGETEAVTPEQRAFRLLFTNEWLKAKIMADPEIEPLAGTDEPTAEDWQKVVAGLGAVVKRLTEERDEAYAAIREAEANALRRAIAECDERVEWFTGVLKLAHDDYIHGRRAEALTIKGAIRALAPPDARASGASSQEGKDFPP